MAKRNSRYAVGIDLGTTYSCVGVWREDRQHVEIIGNEQGNRITPSCVAFKNGSWLIGEAAANEAKRNPANTIYDVKRLIGRKYNDPAIQDDIKKWPFKVIKHENDNPMIVVQDDKGEKKICSPEQISAKILKKMCKYAETYLQAPVKDVVITVPAYFNDSQRQATRKAGAIAGLNVVRIINEPSAAALAYGQEKRAKYVDRERNVFIFDLGGGTFDVSIVNANYKSDTYQVKAKAGNNHLGGEDFVNKMMTYFMDEFERNNRGVDFSGDAQALRNLRTECENAKKELSNNIKEAFIDIYCNGKKLHSRITRGRFEALNKKYFEECMEIVESCFKDAKMDKSSVDDVVLVGGSSRIPKLQELMQDFFKDKNLDKSINVDEAVAYGAAVQAAMLSGSIRTGQVVVLYDVTPLSLGIAVRGNIMSALIPRNTLYPTKVEQKYFTAQDNQTSVTINVYEGQRKIASANNLLGSIHLTGIPPALRGRPITVCFQVDADGILRVSVEEKMAGKMEKKMNKARLSNRDITKLIEEGKMNEAEDEKHVENKEAIKALDKYVYKMEAILKDKKKIAKLSSQDKKNISSAIAKAKKLLGDRKEKEKTTVVKDRIKKVKHIYDSIKAKTG